MAEAALVSPCRWMAVIGCILSRGREAPSAPAWGGNGLGVNGNGRLLYRTLAECKKDAPRSTRQGEGLAGHGKIGKRRCAAAHPRRQQRELRPGLSRDRGEVPRRGETASGRRQGDRA